MPITSAEDADDVCEILLAAYNDSTSEKGRSLRDMGLSVLAKIEKLKKECKERFRASSLNFILKTDTDELALSEKQIADRNKAKKDLIRLRKLRLLLKNKLSTTQQDLKGCGIQEFSSDEEKQMYSTSDLEKDKSLTKAFGN